MKILRKNGILLIIIFIMFILSSCNDSGKRLISENYNMYDTDLLQSINCQIEDGYQTTSIELCDYKDGQLGYRIDEIVPCENKEKNTKVQYVLLDISSNEIQTCVNENYYVDYFFRNPDNKIVEIYKETQNEIYSSYCVKIQDDNNVIMNKEFSNEVFGTYRLNDVIHDDRNIYFNLVNDEFDGCLLVYDYEFNLVNSFNCKQREIHCFENLIDGCLFELEQNKLYRYDYEDNKFNKYSNWNCSAFDLIDGDSFYDFYFTETDDTNEVEDTFLIGYKNNKYYKMLSFNEIGFNSNWSFNLSDNDGGFFAVYFGDDDSDIIYHIKKSNETHSIKDNKNIIKIAGIYSYLDQYIELYNEQSDKYYVEFVEYGNNLEYDEAMKTLYLDAQVGEDIDIISLCGLNKKDFIESGILEDLGNYLNGDNKVCKEDFSDYAIDMMTSNNGKIYSLFNEYSIGGIWGKANIDESVIENYWKEDNTSDILFANTEVRLMFSDLITYSGEKYIDYFNKSINFNESFKKLLKSVKKHKNNISSFENESPAILLKEGKSKLFCEDLRCYYDYLFYYKLFDNSIYCYTENGKPIFKPGMVDLGVCEKSINKPGAYDFLNFVFDYNSYNGISKNMCQGFPTLKVNEEDWKQIITASDTYTNRYGDKIVPFDFEMGIGEYVCTIPPISKDEYAIAEAFIKSAEYIEPMPDKYLDIILEEADLYFEDKKSLDDTVKTIENRVTTALNE